MLQMVRNERFSEGYQRKIEELLKALYPYLQRYKEVPVETKQLNMSLAHFLKVCGFFPCKQDFFSVLNIKSHY